MATKARQQYFADEASIQKLRREFSIANEVQQKIDSIEPGAQVNKIDTVKVNGTALVPDANKAVNINVPDVIDNLYTVDSNNALSAKQGKILYDYIQNLLTIGRFLSNWDSSTGLPITNPSESPYTYKAGDYYRVSNVAVSPATNYKPDGSSFIIGQASTTVETSSVSVSDLYLYDGTSWILLSNSGSGIAVDSSLSTTSTNPVENRVITNALNGKQEILIAGNNIQIAADGKTISATDTTYTAGTGISIDANNVISNTQTSAEWGNIQGEISDQTDLVNELNKKQDVLTAGTDLEIIPGGGEPDTVTGQGSVTLTNAVEGGLNSVTLTGGCEQVMLPNEYTRLEYIQATGTQYIDSGVIANFANNKIEQSAVVEYTTSNSDRELMGTNGYGFWGKDASNKIEAALGNTTVTDNALAKNKISWTTDPTDSNKLTLNVNSNQYTSTASSFVDADYQYYVFALGIRVGSGASASFFCKAKVYSYTILVDDEVVCDLVPCKRNSDNVLGMYDLVSGTFKTNAGTGDFVAGNIVPSPESSLPIICNNGELKTKNIANTVYAGGMSASKVYRLGTTALSGSYTTTSGWKGICTIVPVVAGKTYVRSGNVSNASYRYTTFYDDISKVGDIANAISTVTTTSFTAPTGATYAVVAWITQNSGTTITFSDIQVELGSTATSYLPYGEIYTEGIIETVEDEEGNTATAENLLAVEEYKDTQEILSGEVTRKVGVIILDGTESWGLYATNNGYRSFRVSNFLSAKVRDGICTHLPYYDFNSSNMDRECVAIGGNKTTFYINLAGEERTVDDLKAWLASQLAAGTPVMFIYPLATETTETVTSQTLTTIEGDNTLTITQASIDNLTISANYDAQSGAVINFTNDTGYITSADLSGYQTTANMVTSLSGADNTHYPTAKAVSDAIQGAGGADIDVENQSLIITDGGGGGGGGGGIQDVLVDGTSVVSNNVANINLSGKQDVSNLVTSVSSSSTDSQYPSAKLFYDTCGDIETLINAL